MKLELSLHSAVDIITNSSTVIYTWANGNAAESVKSIINEVLRRAGSDKVADDLFKVYVRLKDSALETVAELAQDDPDALKDDADRAFFEAINNDSDLSWRDGLNKGIEYIKKNWSEEEIAEMHASGWNDWDAETVIAVESLDGIPSNIEYLINNLFHSDGGMDG